MGKEERQEEVDKTDRRKEEHRSGNERKTKQIGNMGQAARNSTTMIMRGKDKSNKQYGIAKREDEN